MSRITVIYDEAGVFGEETDISTQTERRGMDPDKHTRIGEITLGRSYDQAGAYSNLQRLTLRVQARRVRDHRIGA